MTIGNGVTSISEAAFHRYDWNNEEYSPLDVTLRVYENSYAHQYALDEGFKYELIKSAVTKGDADGDGKITVGDALSALRIAARIVPATEELIAICDIDGDGKVTVGDALSILRVAARIVASF